MIYEKYFIWTTKNRNAFFYFNAILWPVSVGAFCLNYLTPSIPEAKIRGPDGPESARVKEMLKDLKSKTSYQKISDSVDNMEKFMLPNSPNKKN
jgi:hypothetical protein